MSTLIALHAVVANQDVESFPLSISPSMLNIEKGETFWLEVRIHKVQPHLHEPQAKSERDGAFHPYYHQPGQEER